MMTNNLQIVAIVKAAKKCKYSDMFSRLLQLTLRDTSWSPDVT